MIPAELPERLRARLAVEVDAAGREHWLWIGQRFAAGYGRVKARRPDGRWSADRAHRVVWEQLRGPIPAGYDLHHVDACRRKGCCNPACLQPLTPAEHARAHHPLLDVCGKGHPMVEANVRRRADGWRECKACVRLRGDAYRARRAA